MSRSYQLAHEIDMSFLFHKRTKKILNVVWGFVAVLIILGMVIFFAPGLSNLFLQ